MSTSIFELIRLESARRLLCAVALLGLALLALPAYTQDTEQLMKLENALASNQPAIEDATEIEVKVGPPHWRSYRRSRHDNGIVSIGHDAHLRAGEKAGAVVSVFGSSTSEGEVEDSVVSILGTSRVSGPVGDAVVAVMGDVYINSKVDGDAVAVIGSIELGPEAEVGGDVVVIGGTLERAPSALIHGDVERVITGGLPNFGGLNSWIKNCLLYGRPLALEPGLGWAWGLALGFLAFYMLLALMFRNPIDRCVQTLETQPGRSTVAALLTLILTPVAFVVLFITMIGIALVPFLWIALMCAGLFGKAVVLAALGRRVTRLFGDGPMAHPAVAILIGGLFVLALYLVPILGFIVYKLLGILGLGVVVYTLILRAQNAKRERAAAAPPPPPSGPTSPEVGAGTAEQSESVPPQAETAAATPQPAVAPSMLPRAGFWIRMGALLIDIILIGILVSFVGDFEAMALLVLAAYGALMWKLRGTTIGGIVCGLQVVRFDGRPIDWSTSIVRALSCFLSLVVAGLGFIWIAFDDNKQAWHDKIAGTLVVRAPRGASLV